MYGLKRQNETSSPVCYSRPRSVDYSLTVPVPLFHAAALYCFINMALYRDTPVAFSVERPLSSDLVVETLNELDADGALLPPAILEDMSQDDTCIKTLQKLNFIPFGGGMSTTPI